MKIEKVLNDLLEIQKMFETTVGHLTQRVKDLEEKIEHLESSTDIKESIEPKESVLEEPVIEETVEEVIEPSIAEDIKTDELEELDTISPIEIAKKEISPILKSDYSLDIQETAKDELTFSRDGEEQTIKIFISKNYIPSNFIDYWRGWHSIPEDMLSKYDFYIFAILDDNSKNTYIIFSQEELNEYMVNKPDELDVHGNISFYFEKDEEGNIREQEDDALNFEAYLNHWDVFK